MKKCLKCNFENEDNAVFCSNCGKKMKEQKDHTVAAMILSILIIVFCWFIANVYLSDESYEDKSDESYEDKYDDIYFRIEADRLLSRYNDHIYEGNIDEDGMNINFAITTNADWATMQDITVEYYTIKYYKQDSGQWLSEGSFSATDKRKLHCIPPSIKIRFVDDRHFTISIDENKGTDRQVHFQITLYKQGEYVKSIFINYTQNGKWSLEEELYSQKYKEEERKAKESRKHESSTSSYSNIHTPKPCFTCHGSGDCYNCHGSGYMMSVTGMTYCPICSASGKCPFCYGSGMSQF